MTKIKINTLKVLDGVEELLGNDIPEKRAELALIITRALKNQKKEMWNEIKKQSFYKVIEKNVKEDIRRLITDEINIAQSEGKGTSRLTSLFNKLN